MLLASCGSDSNSSSPSIEFREDAIYNGDLLLWKFTPPATNQWYEYDSQGRKIFGAGCTFDGCHHYIIQYDDKNGVIQSRYSNEYLCKDFKDLTFPISQTLALDYVCEDAVPMTEESFMITYWLDSLNNVQRTDSTHIEFFNANDRNVDNQR